MLDRFPLVSRLRCAFAPSSRVGLAALLGAALLGTTLLPACAPAQSLPDGAPPLLRQFDTDLSKRAIELSELRQGATKDGIPAIDAPRFTSPRRAGRWIEPQEPVIAVEHNGEARAYPLQILTFHEIVNDRIGGTPVAVTFCPLCYSALVFERTVDGTVLDFGVSGFLRNSDLVMYDRQTETLWQQLTGRAIVGDRTGTTLAQLPAQIISFEQFRDNYPEGRVLSRQTGYDRPYGRNPYAGYDDIDKRPFMYQGQIDDRLAPMAKVVTVSIEGTHVAYPRSVTRKQHVVNDTVAGRPVAIFHAPGAVSALDRRRIAESKEIGSTGAFDRRVDGRTLSFSHAGEGRFTDAQTGTTWTITGQAVEGPLEGRSLERIPVGDHFAFAWFAFRPQTRVYQPAP
jgi:hypothetical protein